MIKPVFWLLLVPGALWAQDYDLLLRGGRVIDARSKIDAVRDIAIKDGKIAAVENRIDPAAAHKVVDVSGLYVTPGLIDIHTHVYAGTGERGSYAGDNSLYPDGFTFRVGVTTIVDAGGSGWRTFADFKDRIIDRSRTRVLALLNIVGNGMRGGKFENSLEDMDAQATAKAVLANKDVVVGIKCAHYSGPEWTPVERAVQAGKIANVPVMIDFGGNFPDRRPFRQLVTEKLRPGDIYTHVYSGLRDELEASGRPNPGLEQGRKRGVIFDVGHGGGSFLWRVAVPLTKAGFWPDSISTDLHIGSMNSGMKDMLNVMSKFLALGMPLPDVIAASTWHPAREIRREELGNLAVGSPADVAVLRLEKGSFGFTDHMGARMKGSQKLACEMTVLNGRVVYDLNGITREDWDKLPARYTSQGDRRWDGTLGGGASRPRPGVTR
ncbi:MAG TPA: amidohydrolase/deacetylase family metallohydrolase [Bryobacteraceae bacterium]|nr:amidohydrolase/deacetylase family metallohydrolase [Bryobacteraceae bacterium]